MSGSSGFDALLTLALASVAVAAIILAILCLHVLAQIVADWWR